MITLILASNSPRRSELLGLIGLPFEVQPADIDETQHAGEPPVDFVRRLACEKADAITARRHGLVVGADTIVVDREASGSRPPEHSKGAAHKGGDKLLGKPADSSEARQMLQQLRGRVHLVYTGIAIIDTQSGRSYNDICLTEVPMRDYADAEIEAYIATGDPMDKAGAYGIQHAGFHPAENLQGCFASVMGLPLCHLMVGLRKYESDLPGGLPERCQAHLNYNCPVYRTILGDV